MNVTCFYDQTPFTLSTEEKVAALRKMHAENLHHYDARCPRCGRANAISRERLEMFTPGWEEAIKAPAAAPVTPGAPMMPPATPSVPASSMLAPAMKAPAKKAASARRRHKPAAKKAVRKAKAAPKKAAKKVARKRPKAKPRKAARKTAARKTARKTGRKR